MRVSELLTSSDNSSTGYPIAAVLDWREREGEGEGGGGGGRGREGEGEGEGEGGRERERDRERESRRYLATIFNTLEVRLTRFPSSSDKSKR